VRLIGTKPITQGVDEFTTPLYLVRTDISSNVNGGVEVDTDSNGDLVFKSGDTVLYTLSTDALRQLEASFTLDGGGFVASLTDKLPSVPGVDSEVSLNSDGSMTLRINSHDLENTITFKPDGEIEIATTATRDIQGQSVELEVTTTLTPRPGVKEPASQPTQVREAAPATKHATATAPARTVAAGKANKPYTYSPVYGDMPPSDVPASGFALADEVNPQTAEYALATVIDTLVGLFGDVGDDAAGG
jgi:hypothetical protein